MPGVGRFVRQIRVRFKSSNARVTGEVDASSCGQSPAGQSLAGSLVDKKTVAFRSALRTSERRRSRLGSGTWQGQFQGQSYGAAEAAGIVTFGDITRRGVISAGRSVSGSTIHVLDEGMRPCPPGAPGEIYIAGEQLAEGYLGDPALTAGRFVANPFSTGGNRLYRTGDLGRIDGSGDAEISGRIDQQVKVRGHRVQPEEVENALSHVDGIAAAAVTAHHVDDDVRLTAHIRPRPQITLDAARVRAALREIVPAYLIPASIQIVDVLPQLPGGKLDRRTLASAAPVGTVAPAATVSSSGVAVVEVVRGVLSKILGVPRIEDTDRFIDLGGDSLSATRVMLRLTRVFGESISAAMLLDNPTVCEISLLIQQATSSHEATP